MNTFKVFLFALVVSSFAISQTTNFSPACELLLEERLEFLVDGSFTDESALRRNLEPLKSCGLDEYDITFFGRMNYMSGILRSLTQTKSIEQLTYGDLMNKIHPIVQSEKYINLKNATQRSEELGNRVGTEQTWVEDRLAFEELGASQRILDALGDYLKENPSNLKTYREILEGMSNN
ncbi:MAG: hypothetical protein WBG46_15990 [Nonlabens sp.]